MERKPALFSDLVDDAPFLPARPIDREEGYPYFSRTVTQQTDKTWQYGQAAATLLVAYMFVLQGLAVGFVVGANSARGIDESICLTARATPSNDKPAGPSRGSHGLDACCIVHCSGLSDGVVASFVQPIAPVPAHAELLTPLSDSGGAGHRDRLPVGARAPPSLAA